jgi:hypothetical protein
METDVTVNDAAAPDNGLLARLRNNHVIPDFDFAARTNAELRAHIDAAIEAARCGPAPVGLEIGDDDDELVEPPAAQRRQRKRSLTKVCEAARKAGADRVIVDGMVIALAPAAVVPESSTTNEWDTVLPEGDNGPH